MSPTSIDPDLCVIAPVWGARYVQRFLSLVLPSWLAPGNIPTLSRGRSLKVFFATRKQDVAVLGRSSSVLQLSRLAQIEFLPIDDLLGPSAVPVSLTLAYQRGLRTFMPDGRERTAVLLNADFVLADGSLRTLAQRLGEGARSIVAPSLRAVEDQIAETLLEAVDDGILAMAPRALVALTLAALHPTAACSRIDQDILWSANPNQLFWRPSGEVLIGRPFCLFSLALVAKGPIGPAGAYVDYGLTPLFFPDQDPLVLDDSDGFFALELAPLNQEMAFVQRGRPDPKMVAQKLSVWSTDYHRRQSHSVIAYKAADPPDTMAAVVADSEAFLKEVRLRLTPPQPLLAHPHWLGGVGEWRASREDRGVWQDPPELSLTPDVRRRAPDPHSGRGVRRLARRILVGEPGRRGPGHPYWSIQRAIRRELASLGDQPIALIGPSVLERFVRPMHNNVEPGAALVGIDLSSPDRVTSTLREIGALPAGTEIRVVVMKGHREVIDGANLADILARTDALVTHTRAAFFNLTIDRQVELIYGALADAGSQIHWFVWMKLLARALVALLRMAVTNLVRVFAPPPEARSPVTALVLSAKRRTA